MAMISQSCTFAKFCICKSLLISLLTVLSLQAFKRVTLLLWLPLYLLYIYPGQAQFAPSAYLKVHEYLNLHIVVDKSSLPCPFRCRPLCPRRVIYIVIVYKHPLIPGAHHLEHGFQAIDAISDSGSGITVYNVRYNQTSVFMTYQVVFQSLEKSFGCKVALSINVICACAN